jgi:cell division protein FtsZ
MGQMGIRAVINANRLHPGIAPIRSIQLGRYGAGGNVNVARAAAKKHDGTLRSLVEGAEIVILTAGLGGGTGSASGPTLARMAMEAGALVLGVIVTPFKWELGRYPNAFAAVKALERHSHYLVSLSNQVVGDLLGKDATLDDLIAQQEVLGTACIHRLMVDASRYCIDRHRHPT